MGMRLIKNVSPVGIKVNITVTNPEGKNITVELEKGESILVSDIGAATKSVLIQTRKGNISVTDEQPRNVVPYEKNSAIEEKVINDEIDTGIIAKTEEESVSEIHNLEDVTTESEIVIVEPIKNKGGRPKGSFKKKGPGRPKSSKKKKGSKKEKPTINSDSNESSDNNTESTSQVW